MSIQFPDYVDVLLACDVPLNEQQVIVNLGGRNVQALTQEAQTAFVEKQKPTFNAHKQELQQISFGKLLQKVDRTRDKLESSWTSSACREKVASKLEALARERVVKKESAFGWFHKVCHKFSQFFQGHGFQTKAQYGLQIAKELRESDVKNLTRDVQEWIKFGGQLNEDLKKNIDSLSEPAFKKLLNNAVFNNRSILFGAKYQLYQLISDDKKAIFRQAIVERNNIIHDIEQIVLSPNDIRDFVSTFDAKVFQDHVGTFAKSLRNDRAGECTLQAIACAVKGWIAKQEVYPIINLVSYDSGAPKLVEILLSREVLTDAEKTYLKTNIKAFKDQAARTVT